ncbi:hypothetical protein ElyMa_000739300 [Elysia marginata]|uniref:Uncharacterized protein n=1 Tax=Elysia marginata TaxID=1093978 RepID=A0AAV4GNQ6_9GAST|nr:hypothetical protein ElyMa_000739300 [Elysia marginata]
MIKLTLNSSEFFQILFNLPVSVPCPKSFKTNRHRPRKWLQKGGGSWVVVVVVSDRTSGAECQPCVSSGKPGQLQELGQQATPARHWAGRARPGTADQTHTAA